MLNKNCSDRDGVRYHCPPQVNIIISGIRKKQNKQDSKLYLQTRMMFNDSIVRVLIGDVLLHNRFCQLDFLYLTLTGLKLLLHSQINTVSIQNQRTSSLTDPTVSE